MLELRLVKKGKRKVILIDGNSLVYRAFFALPTTLVLPSGQVTNAVYGFTSMLIRLFIDERPDIVAVAFDTRAPTHRHGEFIHYKAHREETPNELIDQFPLVKEVLDALAIPIFELGGYEADDLLATLAKRAEQQGNEVLVVTGDRDAFQLIDDNTRVMTTRKGITDIVVYDRERVIERYGIPPEKIPDFLGLKGDPSDNIPGVPGVGDKTAAKLLQDFGDLKSVYERLDKVKPERLRENLAAHEEDARLSKRLATLDFDVPLDINLDDFPFGRWDEARVRQVFSNLSFKSLLERFLTKLATSEEAAAPLPPLPVKIEAAGSPEPAAQTAVLSAHLDFLTNQPALGWSFLADPTRPNRIMVGVAGKDKKGYGAVCLQADLKHPQYPELRSALQALLPKSAQNQVLFDLKSQIPFLKKIGLDSGNFNFDVSLAAYLLEATAGDFSPEALSAKYLAKSLPESESVSLQAGYLAAAALAVSGKLLPELKASGLQKLYEEVEMPLAPALARMEEVGVGLDLDYLASFSAELDSNVKLLEREIFSLAGEEFNLNSPQQLSAVLFDKLKLAPQKKTKTKTAYATDISVLTKLVGEHPVIAPIINYRELIKLKSTYVDALPPLINPATGRIHTSFNQMVTATGRLSSSNPNLQNIPIRTDIGRRIRRAFIPAHRNELLLVADYSQIELRLLAHFSNDAGLLKMFADEADIHQATAAEVFGIRSNEVSPEIRRRAKAINFGIIYGISPYGLAEQLGIKSEDAKAYIEKYLERYPAVKEFLEATIRQAYKDGYVTTILGRRRYLPELKSTNYQVRSFGERVAVNAPLQGSAADIIKLAMVNIDRRLINEGWQTRMVLQVHDELIFEVPPLEEAAAFSMVGQEMENAYRLNVPLKVELAYGRNWGEAK